MQAQCLLEVANMKLTLTADFSFIFQHKNIHKCQLVKQVTRIMVHSYCKVLLYMCFFLYRRDGCTINRT